MLYYVRSYKHVEALWFANTANSLLWWTYVKAFWRALNSVFGEKIKFKTTLKGKSPARAPSCKHASHLHCFDAPTSQHQALGKKVRVSHCGEHSLSGKFWN